MSSIDRQIAKRELVTLGALIEHHGRDVYTPDDQVQAVRAILRGVMDWITDEPTIEALIVEDVARMIARCDDREELRDLSVQIRDLMFDFEPDASRVALTEDEAMILTKIGRMEQ
jgi:hypothetical protein